MYDDFSLAQTQYDQAFEDPDGNVLWFRQKNTDQTGLFVTNNNIVREESVFGLTRNPSYDFGRLS